MPSTRIAVRSLQLVTRMTTAIGGLLLSSTTPAVASERLVPPAGVDEAVAPWDRPSGFVPPPHPLGRSQHSSAAPGPERHPAVHGGKGRNDQLIPLFPRAYRPRVPGPEPRAARLASMARHPAGKGRALPNTQVVEQGDSLWAIATELNAEDPAACVKHLHRENVEIVGSNPDLIFPGQRLELPEDC